MSIPRVTWGSGAAGITALAVWGGCAALAVTVATGRAGLSVRAAQGPVAVSVWLAAAFALALTCSWRSTAEPPTLPRSGSALVVLVAWVGPVAASLPGAGSGLRAAGYAAAVLLPVALLSLGRSGAPGVSARLILPWAIVGVASLLVLVAYDPFRDILCLQPCLPLSGRPLSMDPALLRLAVLLLGVGAVLVASPHLSQRTGGARLIVPVVAAAFVLVTWIVPLHEGPIREDLWAAAVASTALALLRSDVELRRRRRSAREAARAVLAAGTSADAMAEAPYESLTGAERLGLANDRMARRAAAETEELNASRRRIVERADAERLRLGRDLHDIVQQRIVGVMMLASARAASSEDPAERAAASEAVGVLRVSLAHLRSVGREGAPPVLDTHGLRAALRARVNEAGGPVLSFEGDDSLVLPRVARSTYAVVDGILRSSGVQHLRVSVGSDVHLKGAGAQQPISQRVLDRVMAAEGVVVADGSSGGTVEVRLPCES